MRARILTPLPLTSEAFAPFGDVLEARPGTGREMNDAHFRRFDRLATIDADPAGGGRAVISIALSAVATSFPYRFDLIERHPLGSQAFIPLNRFVFVIAVAPARGTAQARDLTAFVTNGEQGINYHRGVWHMPLVALAAGQRFLVVDRTGDESNLELRRLEEPCMIVLSEVER